MPRFNRAIPTAKSEMKLATANEVNYPGMSNQPVSMANEQEDWDDMRLEDI